MRTFIAVELDEALRARLAEAQDRLREAGCSVKWARAAAMHATLKFLGEIEPEAAETVAAAMVEAAGGGAPFAFEVVGLGTFPPRGAPRVVWAGIDDAAGGLARLHRGLERRLARLGCGREKRAFHPHLTLGRVRERRGTERLRALVEREGDVRLGSQEVGEVVLFHSELSPQGARYTPLCRVGLAAEDAGA